MKIPHHPQTREAYDEWCRSLSKQGDPIRLPDLVTEAFCAGWTAAMRLYRERLGEASAEVDEHLL